tara:strand:+ start:818 stop:964 length:147 start_codon:yes stop_codon:yes gene_type:complete
MKGINTLWIIIGVIILVVIVLPLFGKKDEAVVEPVESNEEESGCCGSA